MSQRTRRAEEAVDAHATYLEGQVDGSALSIMETAILDPTNDPVDVRAEAKDYMYGDWGGTFTKMMATLTNEAMTFAVTTDLMREVVLTMEMMEEEGIDWLPMVDHMVPAQTGLVLFPYGIESPYFFHDDESAKVITRGGRKAVIDQGGGDRWFVDGFIWVVSNRISRDNGHGGEAVPGLFFFPLTRWRGRDADRPFRLFRTMHPELMVPPLVASDFTAWAFDEPGQVEWISPEELYETTNAMTGGYKELEEPSRDEVIEDLARNRWWLRSMVWSTFRWLTDEIWVEEWAGRAAARRLKHARPIVHENKPQDDGMIMIVDLRAERREYAAANPDGEPPWWRTRWTVRGHYAKRRYAIRDEHGNAIGPTKGPDAVEGVTFYYKKVYIEPFLKGPENAPLVLKDKVGVLGR